MERALSSSNPNPVPFVKSPKTYEEQVEILIRRGLTVSNKEEAAQFLSFCNYYRFNGYIVPFEEERDRFFPGTTFKQIRDLYEFDRRLRLLVLDGISIIEIYTRTKIAYHLAHKYDGFAHFDVKRLNPNRKLYAGFIDKVIETTEVSKEDFIVAYKSKYSNFPQTPIWMTTEICTFGMLSRLYSGLNPKDQRAIAAEFDAYYDVLASWLHSLSVARNFCAHFSRLWNRQFGVAPKIPKTSTVGYSKEWRRYFKDKNKRCFYILTVIAALLESIKNKNGVDTGWKEKALEFLQKDNLPSVPKFEIGFGIPQSGGDWRDSIFWRC